MTEALSFSQHSDNAELIVAARGRIDSSTAPLFEDQLNGAQATGPDTLIVDLAGIEYMSSAGLRVLLMAAKTAKAGGKRLILCGLSEHLMEVFDVSGFSSIFDIAPDSDTALRKARA